MHDLTLREARRIALGAQGFARPRPSGRVDIRHLRSVVDRIGLIQIDSVNVLARAHYLPLFSRLGPYPQQSLDDLAYRRTELFECWGHMASFAPVHRYPMLRYRLESAQPHRRVREVMEEHPGYIEAVLDEVSRRGPLRVSELADPGRRSGSWWGHGKGKTALEWLFDTGRLAVRDRHNFARVYDLTERVIPQDVLETPALRKEEAHREMLRIAARACGVGTARDLADYYRIRTPDARPRLGELVDSGELREVRVEGWREPAYLHPEARLPRRIETQALLSPFDPLVWARERTERLFGFHYRIEIYVPEAQRQHGYYVLPFLLGEDLVARVDLKSQRDAGTLQVKTAFVEDGRDAPRVAAELGQELKVMAQWLGLERVRVGRRGNLARELGQALVPRPRGRGSAAQAPKR